MVFLYKRSNIKTNIKTKKIKTEILMMRTTQVCSIFLQLRIAMAVAKFPFRKIHNHICVTYRWYTYDRFHIGFGKFVTGILKANLSVTETSELVKSDQLHQRNLVLAGYSNLMDSFYNPILSFDDSGTNTTRKILDKSFLKINKLGFALIVRFIGTRTSSNLFLEPVAINDILLFNNILNKKFKLNGIIVEGKSGLMIKYPSTDNTILSSILIPFSWKSSFLYLAGIELKIPFV